jgi:hypothetical protein
MQELRPIEGEVVAPVPKSPGRGLVMTALGTLLLQITQNKISPYVPAKALISAWIIFIILWAINLDRMWRARAQLKSIFQSHPSVFILTVLLMVVVIGKAIAAIPMETREAQITPPIPKIISQPSTAAPDVPINKETIDPTPPAAKTAKRTPSPNLVTPIPQPSQTVNVDHGSIGGIGTFVNPTVTNNFAPPARRIPESLKGELATCLSRNRGTAFISVISGNPEAGILAQDWFDVFHNAGWSISDNRIGSFLVGGGPTPSGSQIKFHGSIKDDLTDLKYEHNSPGGIVADCLIGKESVAFNSTQLIPTLTEKDDQINVAIYPQP